MDAIDVRLCLPYTILREFSSAVAPTAPTVCTSLRTLALTPISLGRKLMPLKNLQRKAVNFLLFGSRGDFKVHLTGAGGSTPYVPLTIKGIKSLNQSSFIRKQAIINSSLA